MSRQVLRGMNGVNPLGFLASLGLLRVGHARSQSVRLGFLDDGSFRPFIEGTDDDVADVVARDAAAEAGEPPWLLQYDKHEKKGVKKVADLKAPPAEFKRFLEGCIKHWCEGDREAAAFAAAYGTSIAVDGKGNTKPTAFHFTAANQQFLRAVMGIREQVTAEWARNSLFEGNSARSGSNLRWDPSAERNWALMAENPVDEGTRVDAPLEWLAFRGLPLLPSYPIGKRIQTTGVYGRSDEMTFSWPLWRVGASLATVRSLLQIDWAKHDDRAARGVFAVCKSSIRRTSQGFGNFGPAQVAP